MGKGTDKDRRHFFRVDDMLFLEYRVVGADELQRQGHGKTVPKPPRSAVMEQFSEINRHLLPLANEIRRSEPQIMQYLETLNKKIDLLAGHAQFFGLLGEEENGMIRITTPVNLSEGGMAFNCMQPVQVSVHLHIRAVSKTSGVILETYARVIDVKKETTPNLKLPYHIRVEFPYLDDAEKKVLAKHLFTRQREDLRRRNH